MKNLTQALEDLRNKDLDLNPNSFKVIKAYLSSKFYSWNHLMEFEDLIQESIVKVYMVDSLQGVNMAGFLCITFKNARIDLYRKDTYTKKGDTFKYTFGDVDDDSHNNTLSINEETAEEQMVRFVKTQEVKDKVSQNQKYAFILESIKNGYTTSTEIARLSGDSPLLKKSIKKSTVNNIINEMKMLFSNSLLNQEIGANIKNCSF